VSIPETVQSRGAKEGGLIPPKHPFWGIEPPARLVHDTIRVCTDVIDGMHRWFEREGIG